METQYSYPARYWQYLNHIGADYQPRHFPNLKIALDSTIWEEPRSALDFNNNAVIALIEAEQADDLASRELYLDMALSILKNSPMHPLSAAHLAVLYSLIGDAENASRIAFSTLLNLLQPINTAADKSSPGLVYLPAQVHRLIDEQADLMEQILKSDDAYYQSMLLLGEVLWRSEPLFFNSLGLRTLNLAVQLLPESPSINLQLGVANLANQQEEGLLFLHRARQLLPNHPAIIQALYLAYRDLEQPRIASFWLNLAQNFYQKYPENFGWYWSQSDVTAPITYVPFDEKYLLVVEASFRSIVTVVLVGTGTWFEAEMEFWNDWLKPGMTVIDVGANVGVYTFSAAEKVGATGRVLAIEPFSGCVRCLEETCRINQIDWVTVCAGAASDRNGTARLSLHAASELNELVTDETPAADTDDFEEVACFSLDSLMEQENLSKVDFLKIDAEGHEVAVLSGSERILKEFMPIILYENIAGTQGANRPVAEFLQARGYQLFYYQPYLKKLIPIDSVETLSNKLNIIAMPHS
ncbi:MAG: FkbM family methyltransferase [Scytolyngbya sp. HA4215-MV1]|nr:FkbM family methyltransferase [Scytolyngbya sp. HA4215-MV1]